MSLLLDQAWAELPHWRLENNRLVAEFTFDDFEQAFAFMTKVASEAERLNHHPDWRNVYNKVTINLSTHDEDDQVTQKDIDLAKAISLTADKSGAIAQENPSQAA